VGTIHDPVPHEGAKYRRLTGAIHSAFCRHAQAIVCLSEFGRASLARTESPRRLVVIPHPCFTHYAALAPPQAKRTKVTFFGRIEEYKGVEYFLSAAARLAARYPEIEFVVAGTDDADILSRCHPDPGTVTIHNRVFSETDVAQLLASSLVVVLPYISSTQSGVVAAAYGCGCPVIATDVGGLPEVVLHGKTGLLVPPRDVDRLTGAIDLLLSQPGFASALGSGAKQFSERELGWDRVTRDHEGLYRECLMQPIL
jgi:glycosyltransferase involved in cell wall biosynthesis